MNAFFGATTLGRRKRHVEPLVVIRDADFPPISAEHPLLLSDTVGTAHLARSNTVRLEDMGRWEVDVDTQDQDIQGVRIYIPNTSVASRAFFPYPVHLETAQVQKVVMRWMNRMMDIHYTVLSLERLYLHRQQPDLADAAGDARNSIQKEYAQIAYWAVDERARFFEDSGLSALNGAVAKVEFTGSLRFVAALSSPPDRHLVRALTTIDQLVSTYERASLLCDLSQKTYVEGTQAAVFRLERLLSEQFHQLRGHMNQWIKESEQIMASASQGS